MTVFHELLAASGGKGFEFVGWGETGNTADTTPFTTDVTPSFPTPFTIESGDLLIFIDKQVSRGYESVPSFTPTGFTNIKSERVWEGGNNDMKSRVDFSYKIANGTEVNVIGASARRQTAKTLLVYRPIGWSISTVTSSDLGTAVNPASKDLNATTNGLTGLNLTIFIATMVDLPTSFNSLPTPTAPLINTALFPSDQSWQVGHMVLSDPSTSDTLITIDPSDGYTHISAVNFNIT